MKYALAVAALTLTLSSSWAVGKAQANNHIPHSTRVCARAAFLADDWAHTGVKPEGEHRAIVRCARQVGGF